MIEIFRIGMWLEQIKIIIVIDQNEERLYNDLSFIMTSE